VAFGFHLKNPHKKTGLILLTLELRILGSLSLNSYYKMMLVLILLWP